MNEIITVHTVKVNISSDSTKDFIAMDDEKKVDMQAVFADIISLRRVPRR